MNVRKGDTVQVMAGKDRGKTGRVLRVDPKDDRAIVEGVNYVKRHTRAGGQQQQQGGIIEKEAPVHLSNLMVVCGKCGKPVRTRVRTLADGAKVRACANCNEAVGAR